MARYTLELRDVVEHYPIFDFAYPFYDEKKRHDFERNFIRHFYFREIGSPTVDCFKHYLEDKMLTVFPYYNELFRAAEIEYSILDNYNVTETFDRTVEGVDKGNNVHSSVGRAEDSQRSQTDDNRENKSTSSTVDNGTSNNTQTSNDSYEEKETGNTQTARSGQESGEFSKDTTSNGSDTKHDLRRFLDTPQGKLTLKDGATYLTTLNEDDTEESHRNTTAESGEDSRSTTSTETAESVRNTNGSKNGEVKSNGSTSNEQTVEGEDTSKGKTTSVYDGERVERQDANNRHENVANRNEHYELIKKGNIGVDTDADMIQKHIQLQKILKKIEIMFFEECEDLFMLVY